MIKFPIVILLTLMQNPAPLRVLDKGDQSNVDEARQSIVRTAAELKTLWTAHAPDRPLPQVDFAKEMVAAVFLGSRPSAGFAIEIVGTREEAGALVVRYRESRPARGLLTAQVITSAYSIVALPRRDGSVKFERLE